MLPYLRDADLALYNGDALSVLCGLENESVHCVVTSPPYWGLRDYGAEGQLGLEPTPGEYVEALVGIFREIRRVLRSDGTAWLNLGDSYARPVGKGVRGPSDKQDSNRGTPQAMPADIPPGLKEKDLCMVPARVALALQADGWFLRSEITWTKPNPMPESVTDRPTQATEKVYLLSKSARYFYDADAVKEPHTSTRWGGPTITQPLTTKYATATAKGFAGKAEALSREGREWNAYPEGGRNLRNSWEIPTQPYPGAHFAVFPTQLVRRCILAGTSERGCCPDCGAPWTRKAPSCACYDDLYRRDFPRPRGRWQRMTWWERVRRRPIPPGFRWPTVEPVVLDPFLGSGTTAIVARAHGRRCVGIELSADYCELIARRTQQLSLLVEDAA